MSSGLSVTLAIAGDTLDLVRLALAMNEDKRADNASLEAMLRERSRQHGGIMFLDRQLHAPPIAVKQGKTDHKESGQGCSGGRVGWPLPRTPGSEVDAGGWSRFDSRYRIQQLFFRHLAVIRPILLAILDQPDRRLQMPQGCKAAPFQVSLEARSPSVSEAFRSAVTQYHFCAEGFDPVR